MSENVRRKLHFFPLLGIILGSDLIVALVYTWVVPGLTRRALSDTLCMSAIGMGILSGLPMLFDAGRGFRLVVKAGDSSEERSAALVRERQRREQGMVITFAMGAATFIIVIVSFLMEMI
ncbi:MAG: hypothetical protein JXA21_02240 [Anaerolineae bacterium]|nr:hypothetical protein [Anaerolineae bacterium]